MTENGSASSNTGNAKAGLNWPTVVMILASGAGNFFATHQGNTALSFEQQEGLRNIRELHSELDDFKRWQQKAGDNQQQLMANDSHLLSEVHAIAVRLDRLKTLDQQRGAPP